MLALLAFLMIPISAQAKEGVEKVYETTLPEAGNGSKPKPHTETPKTTLKTGEGEPKAGKSTALHGGGNDGEKPESETTSPSEEEKTGHEGNAVPGSNSGNNGPGGNGTQQGNQGPGKNGGGPGGEAKLSQNEALAPGNHGSNSSASSGSSPVLWIVLIVAVLAAISIGVVVLRQRRQDDGGSGSPVSPKAG